MSKATVGSSLAEKWDVNFFLKNKFFVGPDVSEVIVFSLTHNRVALILRGGKNSFHTFIKVLLTCQLLTINISVVVFPCPGRSPAEG